MNIQEERQLLFDNEFKPKLQDITHIKNFCQEITNITGIQVITNNGMMYEYIAHVYQSALSKLKESN